MSSTAPPSEIQELATCRADQLRMLSFAQIADLPPRQDATERVSSRVVAVTTYFDRLPDGRIRVVVQAYCHRFLGIGTMTADGFIIASDGTRTPVLQEMMWEFL